MSLGIQGWSQECCLKEVLKARESASILNPRFLEPKKLKRPSGLEIVGVRWEIDRGYHGTAICAVARPDMSLGPGCPMLQLWPEMSANLCTVKVNNHPRSDVVRTLTDPNLLNHGSSNAVTERVATHEPRIFAEARFTFCLWGRLPPRQI